MATEWETFGDTEVKWEGCARALQGFNTQSWVRSEPGLFKGNEERFYITRMCTTSCWFQTSCWWCLIRECLSYAGFSVCLHVFLLPFVMDCSAAAHTKSLPPSRSACFGLIVCNKCKSNVCRQIFLKGQAWHNLKVDTTCLAVVL